MNLETWKNSQKLKKTRKTGEDSDKKVRNSLKYSVFDASFHSIMVGFGESFFSAFAVFLKASNLQLGLLGSLPQALGSVLQLFSEKLLKLFKSRKKFVCAAVLLQSLMYVPIALTFFFGTLKVYNLILFIALYFIFGMISNSAWSSWMGDLVNGEERGRYFSRRNSIAGSVSFISLLISGYILQHFVGDARTQFIGFAVIFSVALLSRLLSLSYLLRKYEPKFINYKEDNTGFVDFIKQSTSKNYGMFIIFLCVMNFSIYIAAPFFAAYMLYDLKLSYIEYTILIGSAVISKYFSMPIWGKAVDRYGTRKILTLAGFLMPAVSPLWMFSENFFYLMVVQFYSGFVWAGFEIASFNFFFDTIMPQKRSKYISYSNALNGIALFLGAVIGGLLVKYNSLFISKYYLVFLISGIFRYAASFIFIPRLKEIREVDRISYRKLLFDIVSTMTTQGFLYDIVRPKKRKMSISVR